MLWLLKKRTTEKNVLNFFLFKQILPLLLWESEKTSQQTIYVYDNTYDYRHLAITEHHAFGLWQFLQHFKNSKKPVEFERSKEINCIFSVTTNSSTRTNSLR